MATIVTAISFTSVAGVPILVAKCSGGAMIVEEIAVQPQSNDANIQFFEGLPPVGSLGNPISFNLFVPKNQLWSKPGKEVTDNIYMVVQQDAIVGVCEVRSCPC